jgi:hypothetical protein
MALSSEAEDADLVAAYMALWRFAYGAGPHRDRTAAGARAIRKALGCTDYRSKRLLRDLAALRYGLTGEQGVVVPMMEWNDAHGTSYPVRKANADVYMLPSWGKSHAYVPSLLMDEYREGVTPISRLCAAEVDPSQRRDALLVLLHVYSAVDCGDYMGVPPDALAYAAWSHEGSAGASNFEFELGYLGTHRQLHFWLVREDEPLVAHCDAPSILGGDESTAWDRFWPSINLLESEGFLCRVAMVRRGRESYPLWVYSPAYREALADLGLNAGLADDFYRLAGNAGLDADNYLIRAATGDDRERSGTGLFICATLTKRAPVIETVFAPRLHAATPANLDGLRDMARRTAEWGRLLRAPRRGFRASRAA